MLGTLINYLKLFVCENETWYKENWGTSLNVHSTNLHQWKKLLSINNSNETAFHSALQRNPFQLKQIQIKNSGENAKSPLNM